MTETDHALDLVRRLQETVVTFGQLQQETGLSYGKLRKRILTVLSDAEFRAIMEARAVRADVDSVRALRAARPTTVDCMDCGATIPEGTARCGKCGSTRFEHVIGVVEAPGTS